MTCTSRQRLLGRLLIGPRNPDVRGAPLKVFQRVDAERRDDFLGEPFAALPSQLAELPVVLSGQGLGIYKAGQEVREWHALSLSARSA